MSKSTKDFVAIVDLAEGTHEYKFLVDGKWLNDTANAETIDRGGIKNNVIRFVREEIVSVVVFLAN